MSVYVDDMRAPFGRYVMCHCWADSRDELFAMMRRIGVQLKWFQRPTDDVPGMKASWEHFDIALSKRALAVQYGAIETDRYGPVVHTARLDCASGDLDTICRAIRKLEQIGRIRSMRE